MIVCERRWYEVVRSTAIAYCWISIAVVATTKETKTHGRVFEKANTFKIVESTLAGTISNVISISDIEFTRGILQCIFVMHRMRFELYLVDRNVLE